MKAVTQGDIRKPAELSIHLVGVCEGVFLFPEVHPQLQQETMQLQMVVGPSDMGWGALEEFFWRVGLLHLVHVTDSRLPDYLPSFRHCPRCQGFSEEQNQTGPFPLRTSSLLAGGNLI